MAAHLHDSVLQTLALVQRDRRPREVAARPPAGARAAAWLYGGAGAARPDSAAAALDAARPRSSATTASPVEVVAVGDARSTSG